MTERTTTSHVSKKATTRLRRSALACAVPALAAALLLADGSAPSHASAPTPLVQQGPKLTGALDAALPAGAVEGKEEFGRALALSADGNTALVGAPRNGGEAGAAFVLTRSGSTWTPRAELTGGEPGAGEGHFGHNVALSADGTTAAVSAPTLGGGSGAVWVFARTGATWTPQGEKLTGGSEEVGAGQFGRALALSGDGNLLLVGAPADRLLAGAVWVFARSGGDWAQQGATLTGGEESGAAHFGDSLALSVDGATALVGGRQDGEKAGAAWVFAHSDTTFAQQGPKLLATSGESGSGELGWNVALSADGHTALVGGLRDNGYAGAAWLFARGDDGAWTQQGEKLTGAEEQGKSWFGSSVALSADGATALVGGVADNGRAGAVWSFGPPSESTPPGDTPAGGNGDSPGAGGPGAQTTAGGPAGGAPKQGVGAFKAAGGAVVPVGRSFPVRGGHVALELRCTAPVRCRGRLALTVVPRATTGRLAKPIVIARGRFSISRRHTVVLKVALRAAGRAALRRARGSLRASLTIAVSTPAPPRARLHRAVGAPSGEAPMKRG